MNKISLLIGALALHASAARAVTLDCGGESLPGGVSRQVYFTFPDGPWSPGQDFDVDVVDQLTIPNPATDADGDGVVGPGDPLPTVVTVRHLVFAGKVDARDRSDVLLQVHGVTVGFVRGNANSTLTYQFPGEATTTTTGVCVKTVAGISVHN